MIWCNRCAETSMSGEKVSLANTRMRKEMQEKAITKNVEMFTFKKENGIQLSIFSPSINNSEYWLLFRFVSLHSLDGRAFVIMAVILLLQLLMSSHWLFFSFTQYHRVYFFFYFFEIQFSLSCRIPSEISYSVATKIVFQRKVRLWIEYTWIDQNSPNAADNFEGKKTRTVSMQCATLDKIRFFEKERIAKKNQNTI